MKQRFSDKHPILGLLVFTYAGFLISEFVVGVIVMFALTSIGVEAKTATAIGGSIGALLVLIWWYLRNRPQYHSMPRKGEVGGAFKLIFIPMLIYWILLFGSYGFVAKGFPFGLVGAKEVFMALMAGMVEEVCFREIAVSFMAKHWMNDRKIPLIAVVSGLLFGLTHMTNLTDGKAITDTLYQVMLCIFTGVFFAAIYLRKGNVWVLCLFHFIHDTLAFMGVAGMTAKGIGELPDWTAIFIAVLEFMLCLYGFFLIRKKKRQEIIDFWDYKWSRN